MYKVLSLAPKQNGLSLEQARQISEEEHVPYVLSHAPPPLVYKRYYVKSEQPIVAGSKATVDFHVVSEMGFADKAAFQQWLSNFKGNTEFRALQSKFMKIEGIKVLEVEEKVTSDAKPADLLAKGHDKPFHILLFGSKKPGMDLAAYRDFYENQQLKTLLSLGPVPLVWRRFFFDRSANVRNDAGQTGVNYDSVAVVTFSSEAAFQQEALGRYTGSESGKAIADGEDQFMDRDLKMLVAVDEVVTSDL